MNMEDMKPFYLKSCPPPLLRILFPLPHLLPLIFRIVCLAQRGTATPTDHSKSNGKSPIPLNLATSPITNKNDGNDYDEDDLDLAKWIKIKKATANVELNNSIQNALLKEMNEDGTIGTFGTSRPIRVLATAFVLDQFTNVNFKSIPDSFSSIKPVRVNKPSKSKSSASTNLKQTGI
jgi:hypothetical protein